MEKIDYSQSASSLKGQQAGLDPDPSGADSSTVTGCICQLKSDAATNREIPSPEAIQATSSEINKQAVRRIRKKWKKIG